MNTPSQGRHTKVKRSRPRAAETTPNEAEAALREYFRLIDISQDAIFLWRQPGGIELWSKGAAELYGYTEKEARGKRSHDLLKTTPSVPWEEIEKQLREQGSWNGQLRHVTRDGRTLIVSSRLHLLPSKDRTLLVLESNRNVTDLEQRRRAQAITAQFSLDALEGSSIQAVCDDAVHILREHTGADFSSVFECVDGCKTLLLRSGVGWRPGHVGVTRIEVNEGTPKGRALLLNQPIIIEDTRVDKGLHLPRLLRDHHVLSTIAVVIPGGAGAFGVLGIDSKSAGAFGTDEIKFVESIGNVLAAAIARLRFEHELRDTAARLRVIVDTAVDGIMTIDEQGIVETINPAAERIFGYTASEVVGHNVSMLMPEPYHSEHDGYLAHYRRTGERRIIGIGREVRGRRKDGTEFPMELGVSVAHLGKRRIFTGLIRDITQRKHLEQEILEISDHEQQRIGSDLHDDLCQRLAGIRFSCDALRSSLSKIPPEGVADRVEKIGTMVSEAIDRTRTLARGLSPVALESNGLVSALEELTNGVRGLFGVDYTFETKGKIAVTDPMVAIHLYRITQEAINNALKHGHASNLLVSLKKIGDKASLTIEDNGAGFSIDGAQSNGMGLRTIAYRAGMIGADLQVKSKPGRGTQIICTFSPNE